MKITKQLLRKFEDADIEVRTWNGAYKRAVAIVTYANEWEYKVEVERVHPLMQQELPNPESKFIYPSSKSSGVVYEIPSELKWLEEKLYDMAETTSDEVEQMLINRQRAMQEFREMFCL